MGSTQTLHDFVFNLLTNPDARSAFEIDPEGTLRDAGLGDITAADVQDVVPLVVDYAPVQGVTGLVPVDNDLGLGQYDLDPSAVIGQLQSVAQQATAGAQAGTTDANGAVLGALSAPSGLGVDAEVLPDFGFGAGPVSLSGDSVGAADVDVADTLDSDIIDPVLSDSTGAVGLTGDLLDDTLDSGVLGAADAAAGTLTGSLGQVTGLGDSLGVGDSLHGLGDPLDDVGDGLGLGGLGVGGPGGAGGPALGDVDAGSAVGGLTDGLGDTLNGATAGVTGGLGLTGDADAASSGGLRGLTEDLF